MGFDEQLKMEKKKCNIKFSSRLRVKTFKLFISNTLCCPSTMSTLHIFSSHNPRCHKLSHLIVVIAALSIVKEKGRDGKNGKLLLFLYPVTCPFKLIVWELRKRRELKVVMLSSDEEKHKDDCRCSGRNNPKSAYFFSMTYFNLQNPVAIVTVAQRHCMCLWQLDRHRFAFSRHGYSIFIRWESVCHWELMFFSIFFFFWFLSLFWWCW